MEELPDFTDYSMKDRTYRYMKNEALYPFGYGLSYTEFKIDEVKIDTDTLTESGINLSVSITNTGKMKARETIQVYVKADRQDTPNSQLKAFTKVELSVGQVKTICIHLPLRAFSLCDAQGSRIVEPGSYTIYIGDSQPDSRSIDLTGKIPYKINMKAINRVEIN